MNFHKTGGFGLKHAKTAARIEFDKIALRAIRDTIRLIDTAAAGRTGFFYLEMAIRGSRDLYADFMPRLQSANLVSRCFKRLFRITTAGLC